MTGMSAEEYAAKYADEYEARHASQSTYGWRTRVARSESYESRHAASQPAADWYSTMLDAAAGREAESSVNATPEHDAAAIARSLTISPEVRERLASRKSGECACHGCCVRRGWQSASRQAEVNEAAAGYVLNNYRSDSTIALRPYDRYAHRDANDDS